MYYLKISQELKDNYSLGTEESKIKRLQRFYSCKRRLDIFT
ncbi:MAG: hypothetical protein V8R02_12120 [Clostridium sp.]